MGVPRTDRIATGLVLALALTALLTVLVGVATIDTNQPPPEDEGTLAHTFQLSVGLLVPAVLFFVATADWTRPRRSVKVLTLAGTILSCSFGLLYYLEHYR